MRLICNLSHAIDCIPHGVLVSKLEDYGLGDCALRVVSSYLSNRKQIVTWNGSDSGSRAISSGVPQDLVLGPLLFLLQLMTCIIVYMVMSCYLQRTQHFSLPIAT